MCVCVFIYKNTYIYIYIYMLYSQHNGLTLLHKYTSTKASDRVHQSVWHNHMWYHLHRGQIVTTTLDSQLSTNKLLFNQVHLYLVFVTWIYCFYIKPLVFPMSFFGQHHNNIFIYIYICIYWLPGKYVGQGKVWACLLLKQKNVYNFERPVSSGSCQDLNAWKIFKRGNVNRKK